MDVKGDSPAETKSKNVRSFTVDDMKSALEHLKTGKSIREAARLTNVPYATVRRHWLRLKGDSSSPEEHKKESFNKAKETASTSKLKSILKKTATIPKPVEPEPEPLFFNKKQLKLFSEHQEMTLATLFNGKNGTDCRKIAYEMAIEWKITLDKTWVDEKMADVDWITNFRKRLPDLLEKQYRINQKSLAKEDSFKHFNDTSLKVSSSSFLGINKSQISSDTLLRHSNSSELDSFGNDSSNSNHDVDIVKMELNENEPSRKRSNSSWDKRITSIFSGSGRIKQNLTNTTRRRSSEDVKFFLPDTRRQNDPLENSSFNSFLAEKNNDLTDPKHQDEIRSISGRSNNNYRQNRRQPIVNIDENTTTSLHILNDDDNSNESDGTSYSNRSKKSRTDDVQIDKRNFVRMVKGMNAVTKQKLDADELFLLSLLPALKRIAEKDKLKVKIKLLEVVDQF